MQVPGARRTGGRQPNTCFVLMGQMEEQAESWLKFSKSLLVNLRLLSETGLMINTSGEKLGSVNKLRMLTWNAV